MAKNALLFLLLFSCMLILISSNFITAGLVVQNQSLFNINKVYNSNITLSFNLLNTENYAFYNITSNNNSLLYFPQISQLGIGQAAQINAIVPVNTNVNNQIIRIKGFYNTQVGVQNKTWNEDVNYYNGLTPYCDFSVVRGDRVTWHNSVTDDITLRNVDTGNDVTTIPQGQNYTTTFDSPSAFRYVFLRRGFTFTNICTITAVPDTGLINDPAKDALINLSVNIVYNPSAISYYLVEHNYSIPIYQSQDGVLTISNIGNDTARNINLQADWTTFSPNNFDLSIGQTRGIVYTIHPTYSQTSDTNQTYRKTLSITGNFNTVTDYFNVFIPYANMNSSYNQSNYDSLIGVLQQFCHDNPSQSFCQTSPQVVYVGNNTDQTFNVSFSQDQVKSIFEYIFAQGDKQDVLSNYVKSKMSELGTDLNSTNYQTLQALQQIQQLEQDKKSSSDTSTFMIIFFIFLGIACLLGILIFVSKKYNLRNKFEKW